MQDGILKKVLWLLKGPRHFFFFFFFFNPAAARRGIPVSAPGSAWGNLVSPSACFLPPVFSWKHTLVSRNDSAVVNLQHNVQYVHVRHCAQTAKFYFFSSHAHFVRHTCWYLLLLCLNYAQCYGNPALDSNNRHFKNVAQRLQKREAISILSVFLVYSLQGRKRIPFFKKFSFHCFSKVQWGFCAGKMLVSKKVF